VASTVLVTGANGFVGRAVCDDLARRGYGVRAAVRDRGRALGLPGEIVEVGALGRATDWSEALEGVNSIIHLAARVHVMEDTAADPLALFREINVHATRALAMQAARRGVRRLVYASSIKVNGESTGSRPYRPDDEAAPQDPYGYSKWEAEQALREIAGGTPLEVTIVRPPLVYGPRVGGNFRRLLGLARRGIPLPFGAVRNRRSLVYVENLSSALIACASDPRAAGHVYLVSDGPALSTAELIAMLARSMGAPARLVPVPVALLRLAGVVTQKSAEMARLVGSLVVDDSLLKSTLGWSPPFTAEQGLKNTADWFVNGAGDEGDQRAR
jgi:nucleoside-diphosphate-sugar epimerase